MKQSNRLAEFLPYRLSVTSNAVSQRIAQEYRIRWGLSVPEWRVMAVLGDSGPHTATFHGPFGGVSWRCAKSVISPRDACVSDRPQ